MSEPLHFLFGVHNHQPIGNFEGVIEDAVARSYDPFLRVLRQVEGLSAALHCSGGLLQFIRERARPTYDLLGEMVAERRVELLTGGFYEPILSVLPDADKVGQIQALTAFLRADFGVAPRGMWLAERVWEPQLPRALREAGVEFVLLDDAHFSLAGLDPATLSGYYTTDEQGAALAIFPISQRLRYLVPFADPAETIRYLEARRGAGALTLVDDGEKFGVWPGTDRLVYGEGWLIRFLEGLRAAPWLRVSAFSDYLDTHPPHGRVYLPTASYTEMCEWALPAAAVTELEDARRRVSGMPDGARLAGLLRGGFWRNFLTKYPEMGDAYWKMLRLSRRVSEGLGARPDDARLLAARERLWQSQANDAYWHGVFGGCYLPHLRRAVRAALIECDTLVRGPGDPAPEWERADIDGDGRVEVSVRTGDLSVTLRPERGGTLTEWCGVKRGIDVADVLTRRPEGYHVQVAGRQDNGDDGEVRTIHAAPASREEGLAKLLEYDTFRRASLLDGLFPGDGELDCLDPWPLARVAIGERRMAHEVRATATAVEAVLSLTHPDGAPLRLQKTIRVPLRGGSLDVVYRIEWDGEPLDGRWAVQWNVALTAGDAPGRYYEVPGRPSLGSRGRIPDRRALEMVDEWLGGAVRLEWSAPGEVAWAPVETVSLSEAGFERIFQGSCVLVSWPVDLRPGQPWEVSLRATVT